LIHVFFLQVGCFLLKLSTHMGIIHVQNKLNLRLSMCDAFHYVHRPIDNLGDKWLETERIVGSRAHSLYSRCVRKTLINIYNDINV
jgi:hypothetical protein